MHKSRRNEPLLVMILVIIWIFSSWFPNLDHVHWFGYLFLHFWVFEVLIVAEESPGDRCDMAVHENVNIGHGDHQQEDASHLQQSPP